MLRKSFITPFITLTLCALVVGGLARPALADAAPAPAAAPSADADRPAPGHDDALFDRANHVSAGFHIGAVDGDFALGLGVTSPYILGNRLALRVSGQLTFLQGTPQGEAMAAQMPYGSVRVGLIGVGGTLARSIRLYGEGGVVLMFPSGDFSDDTAVGGYGLFGFEFFMSSARSTPVSYFIELGSQGSGARAEKLMGQPHYGNGFSANVGLRAHL